MYRSSLLRLNVAGG